VALPKTFRLDDDPSEPGLLGGAADPVHETEILVTGLVPIHVPPDDTVANQIVVEEIHGPALGIGGPASAGFAAEGRSEVAT